MFLNWRTNMLETLGYWVLSFLRTDLPIVAGKCSTSWVKNGWDNTKLSSNLEYIFAHVFHNLLLIFLRFITYIWASDSSDFKNKANKATKCRDSAIMPKTIFLLHGRDWHRNVTQEENIINMKKSYNFWIMLACLGS